MSPRIQSGAEPVEFVTVGRPAETATGVAGVGALLAYVFGVRDPEAMAAMVAGVALVPGVVTWLVSSGGVRGALRLLWRGRG